MFALEFFVGQRMGGWLRGSTRFASAAAGATFLRDQRSREARADMMSFLCRVVPV